MRFVTCSNGVKALVASVPRSSDMQCAIEANDSVVFRHGSDNKSRTGAPPLTPACSLRPAAKRTKTTLLGAKNEQLLQYGLAGVGALLLLGSIMMAGTREYKLKGVKIAQIAGAASVVGYSAGYVAGRRKGRAEGHVEGMHL